MASLFGKNRIYSFMNKLINSKNPKKSPSRSPSRSPSNSNSSNNGFVIVNKNSPTKRKEAREIKRKLRKEQSNTRKAERTKKRESLRHERKEQSNTRKAERSLKSIKKELSKVKI